ncbi:hypothetical protein ACHAWF_001163 [Thalassiosira exigua]
MKLDRAEAVRLARRCLPAMLAERSVGGEGVPSSSLPNDAAIEALSEKDVSVESMCRLWAGMGCVYRVTVRLPGERDGGVESHRFVAKKVVPPPRRSRSFGDERKAASYRVEAGFYEEVAPTLIEERGLSIPVPYHVERSDDDRVTICMSLLSGSSGLSDDVRVRAALEWLASLHAATWGAVADDYVRRGLAQPIGSYWHLDTRPDEHDAMPRRGWEGRLRMAARAIDERLRRDGRQCCVHGDAKDANMLFGDGGDASMYDFQYFGKAPPSVDLAYFLCVAVGDTDSEYIRYYHQQLIRKLDNKADCPTLKDMEDSVALALCDFQRFMSGWGQWGSDVSSNVIAVLDRLDGGTMLRSEDAYREAMHREFG